MWPIMNRLAPVPTESRAAPVEDRASYTDAAIAYITESVAGDGPEADYRAVAAAQAAASMIGKALAAATLNGATAARTGLTGAILHDIGCALTLDGEAVYLIDVSEAGVVSLKRASDHDVIGGPDLDSWRYRVTIAGPTRNRESTVPAAAVFHPRINTSPQEPHKGRSPIGMARQTARLAAHLERLLANEAAAPGQGYVLPAPLDHIKPDALDSLKGDLRKLKGRTSLVPTFAAGLGDGRAAAPAADWKPSRLGFNPPDIARSLRGELFDAILSLAGVPPTLYGEGRAEGKREALRQFLHATLQPLAKVIQREAQSKLLATVTLDFAALGAADVQGRARAFKSLTDGGMAAAEAARVTGLTEELE